MSTQQLETITGYLRALPKGASQDGSAKAALVTEKGDEYYILHKGAGVDLMAHISADATLKGIITLDGETNYILVRSYSLADSYEDYAKDLYDSEE